MCVCIKKHLNIGEKIYLKMPQAHSLFLVLLCMWLSSTYAVRKLLCAHLSAFMFATAQATLTFLDSSPHHPSSFQACCVQTNHKRCQRASLEPPLLESPQRMMHGLRGAATRVCQGGEIEHQLLLRSRHVPARPLLLLKYPRRRGRVKKEHCRQR